MKKRNVDNILVHQAKRRKTIIIYLCFIIFFSALAVHFSFLYIENTKNYNVNYSENSNIDYKVYLKENNFFKENYLGKNNEYIASLINYINATFKYEMALDNKDADFTYKYKINAEVNVKGKNNSLYNFNEELLETKEEKVTNQDKVTIEENINIDYNHFNDIVKSFVNTYGLNDSENTLTISMYVDIIGSCTDFKEDASNEKVISLIIPLTTKTMAVELSSDLVESKDNIIVCSQNKNVFMFIIIVIASLINSIFYIVTMIKYIIKSRTAEDIYQKELKKILNNYHSYIQKINNNIDLNNYQLLKVDNFTDMLEIRDTLNQPILMVENVEKKSVFFIIPSSTNILYMYTIKVSDIKKKMKTKN